MLGLRWGPDEHRFLFAGALVMKGSAKQEDEWRNRLFVVDWFSIPLHPALYCGWIAGRPRAETVGSAERSARKPAEAPEGTRPQPAAAQAATRCQEARSGAAGSGKSFTARPRLLGPTHSLSFSLPQCQCFSLWHTLISDHYICSNLSIFLFF